MKRYIVLILIMYSCESPKKHWNSDVITNPGVYEYNGLSIHVSDQNDQVWYSVLNSKGDTLITKDRKFSTFQRWAIQLDQNMNIWILSSDIGHSYWRRNSSNEQYEKHEFFGKIHRDSIPDDVFKTLSNFYPYSVNKEN